MKETHHPAELSLFLNDICVADVVDGGSGASGKRWAGLVLLVHPRATVGPPVFGIQLLLPPDWSCPWPRRVWVRLTNDGGGSVRPIVITLTKMHAPNSHTETSVPNKSEDDSVSETSISEHQR